MHSSRLALLVPALALAAAVLTACGGGSGGLDNLNLNPIENVTLPADGDRSGGVLAINGVPGSLTAEVMAGKATTSEVRGVVVFPFTASTLPAGSQIVSATLSMVPLVVNGNPTVALGAMTLDHVDAGPALDLTDFAGGILSPAFANLLEANEAVTTGIALIQDVTAQLQADSTAGRTASAFRLAFPGPATANLNQVAFSDTNAGLNLIVQFRRP